MKKKTKVIIFIIIGILSHLAIFLFFYFVLNIESFNTNKVINDLVISQYKNREDVVYIDSLEAFYYSGKKYDFKKKELVYEKDVKIYNNITKKIYYLSDNFIIYKRYFYEKDNSTSGFIYKHKYFIIVGNEEKVLNIPESINLKDIIFLNDAFVFKSTIDNKCFYYDLSLNKYQSISNSIYESYNKKYDLKYLDYNKIEVNKKEENITKTIDIDNICENDLAKELRKKCSDFSIMNVEIVNDSIFIIIRLSNNYTIIFCYDFENNNYSYYDFLYHENDILELKIYFINEKDNDSAFKKYIKTYEI